MAQMVKNLPAMQEIQVLSLSLGRSPGEGNGNPLQYSCPENLISNKYGRTLYELKKKKTSVFGMNTGSAQQLLINKNKQLDIMT